MIGVLRVKRALGVQEDEQEVTHIYFCLKMAGILLEILNPIKTTLQMGLSFAQRRSLGRGTTGVKNGREQF